MSYFKGTTIHAIKGKTEITWKLYGPIPRAGETIDMPKMRGLVKQVIWCEDEVKLLLWEIQDKKHQKGEVKI